MADVDTETRGGRGFSHHCSSLRFFRESFASKHNIDTLPIQQQQLLPATMGEGCTPGLKEVGKEENQSPWLGLQFEGKARFHESASPSGGSVSLGITSETCPHSNTKKLPQVARENRAAAEPSVAE